MSAPLLSLHAVSKNFGGLAVISDVSFDVPQGSRTALIGPNGAGKTTLLNLISGVFAPSEGEIRLEGQPIDALPSRSRIGLGIARSFQNIRLMPHLSVVENVMLGQHARAGSLAGMLTPLSFFGRSRWRREAEELLDRMGLSTYPGEVVATLPYGIRKKIEVVRALVAQGHEGVDVVGRPVPDLDLHVEVDEPPDPLRDRKVPEDHLRAHREGERSLRSAILRHRHHRAPRPGRPPFPGAGPRNRRRPGSRNCARSAPPVPAVVPAPGPGRFAKGPGRGFASLPFAGRAATACAGASGFASGVHRCRAGRAPECLGTGRHP